MNLKRCLLLAFGLLAAAQLSAKPVEAIAFHGTVDDGTTGDKSGKMVTLDFKLYSAEAETGELLWARRVPVSLDSDGGFYIELADSTGQSYQSTDGRTPASDTLAGAFARHASLSQGPVWIEYTPVDAKVTESPARDPLYYQPVAVRALAASGADIVRTKNLTAKTFVSSAPIVAEKIVSGTTLLNASNLKLVKKSDTVTLNPSGAVRLKSLAGFSYAIPDADGVFTEGLPATADSDCGRVVRRTLANGKTTHETLFYVKGDATAAPADTTTIYIWTFGKLEAK